MSFSGSMNKPGMHLARRTLVPVFVKTVKIDAPEYISVQPTPFWPWLQHKTQQAFQIYNTV